MEGDVAFDLLHQLMDVAVENGDRSKALQISQRLSSVVRAPAPGRINRPQGDVCENDDRRRGREVFDVLLKPFELLRAYEAEPAGFEIGDIDEADEMDAALIKRVPAAPLGVFAVALEVGFAGAFIDDVVLTRHVVHVEPAAADKLLGVVELCRFRKMRDVAGVQHEGRLVRDRLNPVDGFFQRIDGMRISGFVEADVAIGNLQEREALGGGFGGLGISEQTERLRHAAGQRP